MYQQLLYGFRSGFQADIYIYFIYVYVYLSTCCLQHTNYYRFAIIIYKYDRMYLFRVQILFFFFRSELIHYNHIVISPILVLILVIGVYYLFSGSVFIILYTYKLYTCYRFCIVQFSGYVCKNPNRSRHATVVAVECKQ